MKSFVHYTDDFSGRPMSNAFWSGGAVYFGDGDGVTDRNYSGALDVVAHEWSHGVTEYTSKLVYQGESGALNEAFSDIMGSSIEFYAAAHGQDAAPADWFIGEDIDLVADTK